MKNSKKFRLFIVLTLTLVLCIGVLAFTACDNDTDGNNDGEGNEGGGGSTTVTLSAPENVSVSEIGVVSWDRVKGAKSYELDVNGTSITIRFTQYDLYDFDNRPADGKFTIKVRAVAEDATSDWAPIVTYTLDGGTLLYPIINGVNNGVVSWDSNAQASGLVVKINGEDVAVSANTNSYDLSSLSGKVTFAVGFKGDGIYYKDSELNTIIYDTATGEVSLPAPKNVRMEGLVLKFDAVIGADVYYLRDYNNSVVMENTNIIDISSGFLTKSVSAGTSNGIYNTSEETDVVYFGEDDGTGTKDSPFIIRDVKEFRYIEYYEGIGQSKYYELAGDMIFEEIELKDDEYGTNAYKMGSFSGVLDGKGYALKNMKVYYRDGYSSIFDSVNANGVIKNLVIDNADWRTWTVRTNDGTMHEKGGDVAIICNTNRGLIENVTVKNSSIVAVVDGASALVAINRGTVRNCVVRDSVTISGKKESGSMVIYNAGEVASCINYADISGGIYIGGIVGRNAGIVSTCDNYGDIEGNKQVGGIVGYNYNVLLENEYDETAIIKYCSNHGLVKGATEIGGIAGKNGNDGTGEIGNISVAGAGIFHCYNKGAVNGANSIGGIVGSNFATKSLTRGVVGCYNSGKVENSDEILQRYKRIYLNASNCDWIANDNAVVYCYFWNGGATTIFPGEPMTHFTVNGANYYYVDIEVEEFSEMNVIFSRGNYSGSIYGDNKTIDLTPNGNDVYTLPADFNSEGTWGGSTVEIRDAVGSVCGGIAGTNNQIDDCYYLATACEVVSNANGIAQTNVTKVGGEVVSEQVMKKSATDLASDDFVDTLNAIDDNNVWVKGEDAPKFAWQ